MVLLLPLHAEGGAAQRDMEQRTCLGVSQSPKGPEMVQLRDTCGQRMELAILLILTILPRRISKGRKVGEGAARDMLFLKRKIIAKIFIVHREREMGFCQTVVASLLYFPPFYIKKKNNINRTGNLKKKKGKKSQATNHTGDVILDDPSPSINLNAASLLAGKDHFKHP